MTAVPRPLSSHVQLLADRAALARMAQCPVPSPCVSVCRMDEATGWCAGCFRTLAEITAWSRAAETDKRHVWALVAQRAQLPESPTS